MKEIKILSRNYFELSSIFDTQNRANLFECLALIIFINRKCTILYSSPAN